MKNQFIVQKELGKKKREQGFRSLIYIFVYCIQTAVFRIKKL